MCGTWSSSVTTPAKRLRRFARVELVPGESKQISFTLYAQDMSYIGTENKPVLEPGLFEVMAGRLTGQFRLV